MQIELDNVSLLKSLFESGENSAITQKKIADFFPAIIFVYDTGEKRIRYANQKFTEVFGYTNDDLKSNGFDLLSFVFKEDIPAVEKELFACTTLQHNHTHSFNSAIFCWRVFS